MHVPSQCSDEVRRAFHLGDKDSVPQSPPRKGGREALPRPVYRRFFHPQPLSEEEEVALRQQELTAEQQRAAQEPPAKRVKSDEPGAGLPPVAPAPPPAPAPVPAPAPPPVPVAAPALVLPSLDVSQLVGLRRKVSELTQPEVLTVRFFFVCMACVGGGIHPGIGLASNSHNVHKPQIAEEITKKLRAKRVRAWKGNPLETDITRENCAAMGIPNYFDFIETPMNLTLIMVRGVLFCVWSTPQGRSTHTNKHHRPRTTNNRHTHIHIHSARSGPRSTQR